MKLGINRQPINLMGYYVNSTEGSCRDSAHLVDAPWFGH